MFGYITPFKPELKIREYEQYRAVYCGLCKELGRRFGLASRFLLNYDMVFLAVVADGLSGNVHTATPQRCIANPFTRHPVSDPSPGIALAADCLLLLSYYKAADDLADGGPTKRMAARLGRLVLSPAHRRAASRWPQLDTLLKDCTADQQKLERDGCTLPDRAAEPTARMTAGLFEVCSEVPEQQKLLRRFGLFLGQIIYLLDAAEDYDKDRESGSYNVYLKAGLSRQQMLEAAATHCRLAAGTAAGAYSELQLRLHKNVLDNILYLGLPYKIDHMGCSCSKKERYK